MDYAVRIVRSNSNDSPQFPGEKKGEQKQSLVADPASRVRLAKIRNSLKLMVADLERSATAATAGVNDVVLH